MSAITRKNREGTTTIDGLARTAWPMIHCDEQGTKTSTYSGPVERDAHTVLTRLGTDVILMLTTPDTLYVQEAENYLKALDPETLEEKARINLDASFPFFAGGTMDLEGNMWFTANDKVARITPDLNQINWSEKLEPDNMPYNTCFFLPDGNLLVTTSIAAHVVSPVLADNTFRVLSSLDLTTLNWKGKQVFTWYPVTPRPVSDGKGGLYFCSNGFVSKLIYDRETQSIAPEVVWAVPHGVTDSSFIQCDPVLVGENVYAVAKPQESTPMKAYSINATSGNVEGICEPFPDAPGATSAHTLGAVKEQNKLIVICQTDDLTGGMAAVDATSMKRIWHAPIAVVGGAFCCSLPSNRAYIISRDPKDQKLKYWAVHLDDGSLTVLREYLCDTDPNISLASIGYDGRLYYPNPAPGLAMIRDR